MSEKKKDPVKVVQKEQPASIGTAEVSAQVAKDVSLGSVPGVSLVAITGSGPRRSGKVYTIEGPVPLLERLVSQAPKAGE